MFDIDIDTLAEWAEKALERPSDAAFWDERLYETHGATLSWAERGDDILEESNYLSALDLVKGAAEREEDVIDASIGHWLVGSLRQLFVRVYEDDGVTFTAAWREVVEIGEGLASYPIVDESDFSEREYERWQKNVDEALDDAKSRYEFDTEDEVAQIFELAEGPLSDTCCQEGNGEVSWDLVAEIWAEARDQFFTSLVLGVHPHQLQLDIAV